jgi:hypothetical protein
MDFLYYLVAFNAYFYGAPEPVLNEFYALVFLLSRTEDPLLLFLTSVFPALSNGAFLL